MGSLQRFWKQTCYPITLWLGSEIYFWRWGKNFRRFGRGVFGPYFAGTLHQWPKGRCFPWRNEKNELAAWSGKFEIYRQPLQGDPEKQEETSERRFLFSDTDRTQTCNLLIRSQMLYSIKLRRRIANANVGQCWLTDSYSSEFCRWFSLFRAVARRGLHVGLHNRANSMLVKQ